MNELKEELKDAAWGSKHLRWMKIQDEIAAKDPELAKDKRGINIVVPTLMSSDDETQGFLRSVTPTLPRMGGISFTKRFGG